MTTEEMLAEAVRRFMFTDSCNCGEPKDCDCVGVQPGFPCRCGANGPCRFCTGFAALMRHDGDTGQYGEFHMGTRIEQAYTIGLTAAALP